MNLGRLKRSSPEPYRAFDPTDYPAYEFAPDGTPHRVVPATRGKWAGWTGPISSYVRRGNAGKKFSEQELFGITRGDGIQKQVSRNTILKALGKSPVPAGTSVEDPWAGPEGNLFPRRTIDDFPDYVCDARGKVWRFQSPGRGQYARPQRIGLVTPGRRKLRNGPNPGGYYYLDSIAGDRRYLSIEKVLDRAGWTEKEIRDARNLEIAIAD